MVFDLFFLLRDSENDLIVVQRNKLINFETWTVINLKVGKPAKNVQQLSNVLLGSSAQSLFALFKIRSCTLKPWQIYVPIGFMSKSH